MDGRCVSDEGFDAVQLRSRIRWVVLAQLCTWSAARLAGSTHVSEQCMNACTVYILYLECFPAARWLGKVCRCGDENGIRYKPAGGRGSWLLDGATAAV